MLQPTTRLHVSGYRFLVRRMEHALVRGDTRMLDDPLRAQSISLAAGAVLASIAVVVCTVLALLRPAGELGDAPIVVVRDTGAMYVRIGVVLHPVFNLASARLIAGTPADPHVVGQQAVDSARRGTQVGIPGAPQQIATPLSAEDSAWTVCDDARGETIVVAGRIADGTVAPGAGVLVTPRDVSGATTYLLYGGRRAQVDLRHPAVVRALRLEGSVPRPISGAVLAAIPEAPEIMPPHIPEAGSPGPRTISQHPVGAVLKVHRSTGESDGSADYFVVLAEGVQRIGEVTADLIRYTDSRVGEQIPAVAPSVIGALPIIDSLPVTTFPERMSPIPPYPQQQLAGHGGANRVPVICAHWRADPAGRAFSTAVLVGEAPPLISRSVELAQADAEGSAVDAVSMPSGRSAFVRSVGLTGSGQSTGSLFLVTDSGVRYGIRDSEAASILGLTDAPQPAPWPMLALLPQGPELSRSGASVTRDVIVAAP
ncbi:MAG: type VII secretion protein EccB [Actinomycetia bacterium]|nr:type VII secretion protein EccB [Actinomycetes bacterium]